jgi:hypothetical protein
MEEARRMARFYFHLWCGGQLTADDVGAVLPTLEAAQRRAECLAASIADEREDALSDLSGWDIEVIDGTGRTVLLVPVQRGEADIRLSRAA